MKLLKTILFLALHCPNYRRRLRAAAGRKTLFGSSEPDVTLADGCC